MKRRGNFRRVVYFLEYGCLRFAGMIFSFLPKRAIYCIASLGGWFAYSVLKARRRVSDNNIKMAFSDLPEKERRRIALNSYINIGTTFLEMLNVERLSAGIGKMADLDGISLLKERLAQGRGLIVISGHFGSWELNGATIAMSGVPITAVAKKQSNPYVDKLINSKREKFNQNVISRGAPVKKIVEALRKGEAVGLISDQDAGKSGTFPLFFGEKASTPKGAAQLALKYGCPMVVAMLVRTGKGRYKGIYRDIEVKTDDTIDTLTQRYTTEMENIIRQYPDQYFWMHRRWKTSEKSHSHSGKQQ